MYNNAQEILQDVRNLQEYEFINKNEHLKNRIVLLGVGGSYSYGAQRETSDLDIRGIVLERPQEIIGNQTFKDYRDDATDSFFWGFNRAIDLLMEANPSMFELLGLNKDFYLYLDPIGRTLVDNSYRFVSKLVEEKFIGFGSGQLRRLQNALAKEVSQPEKEFHILNSIINSSYAIKGRYKNIEIEQNQMDNFVSFANSNLQSVYRFNDGIEIDENTGKYINGATRKMFRYQNGMDIVDGLNKIQFYIDESQRKDYACEIYFDANFSHYPLRDVVGLLSEFKNTVADYDRITKKATKEENQVNKNMATLYRIIYEATHLIKTRQIKTALEGETLALYKAILNGEYRTKNGDVQSSYYDLIDKVTRELDEAKLNSNVPDTPDLEWIEEFKIDVNRKIVNGYETKLI